MIFMRAPTIVFSADMQTENVLRFLELLETV